MGGCFGNHPVDRWMESQLFAHLADGADFENWVENVWNNILDSEISNEEYDENDSLFHIWEDYLAMKGYCPNDAARIILRTFKKRRNEK